MITIQIQENESFDRLSILEVKKHFSKDPIQKQTIQSQIEELSEQINIGIGYDKAKEIYESVQYKGLYNYNLDIFNLIDELNQLEKERINFDYVKIASLGMSINNTNYSRFLAKKELQKEFFNNKNEEIKLGY